MERPQFAWHCDDTTFAATQAREAVTLINHGEVSGFLASVRGFKLVTIKFGGNLNRELALATALHMMLEAYAPGAAQSAIEHGEDSLHSAVRAARAALRL